MTFIQPVVSTFLINTLRIQFSLSSLESLISIALGPSSGRFVSSYVLHCKPIIFTFVVFGCIEKHESLARIALLLMYTCCAFCI